MKKHDHMNCKHENRIYEPIVEEVWSNGMFGIPASNMPLYVEICDEKITCADCGHRLNALGESIELE